MKEWIERLRKECVQIAPFGYIWAYKGLELIAEIEEQQKKIEELKAEMDDMGKDATIYYLQSQLDILCEMAKKTKQLLRNVKLLIQNPKRYNLEHNSVLLIILRELYKELQQDLAVKEKN